MSPCTSWRSQELNRLYKKGSMRKKSSGVLTGRQIDISVIFLQEVFRAGSFLNVILNFGKEKKKKKPTEKKPQEIKMLILVFKLLSCDSMHTAGMTTFI